MNNLENCFKQGLLRKAEPSIEKGKESIRQAKEWLSEAVKSKDAGAYKSAVSSAYLAFFHAARAVLFPNFDSF